MIVNDRAMRLIREFEGCRLEAYRDPAGVWTIGYGTTAAAGVGISPSPGMTITEAQAEMYLRLAVEKFAARIEPAITRPITGNQFGAFASLAYNIGPGSFTRSSALRHFNAGDTDRAAASISLWNKITVNGKRQTSNGLVRRRSAERALFLTPDARVTRPAVATTGLWAAISAFLARIFGAKA